MITRRVSINFVAEKDVLSFYGWLFSFPHDSACIVTNTGEYKTGAFKEISKDIFDCVIV